MIKDQQEYISPEKKIELENELSLLRGPQRKEILESLEAAKAFGDLSENAEYHQAREAQRKLEERVQKIEHVLKNSIVALTKIKSEIVTVGSKLIVQKVGSQETKSFQIVGSEEADMANGKISNKSPLGEALIGKKRGDTVNFKSPTGQIEYKIISLE